MSRRSYDHLHVYQQVFPGSSMFRCIVPECVHTISKHTLIGRPAKCPLCEMKFVITDKHLKVKLVHCGECKKNRTRTQIPVDVVPVNPPVDVDKIRENVLGALAASFRKKEKRDPSTTSKPSIENVPSEQSRT